MKLLFEWDANKAHINRKKHKVSFEEAKTVFNDPLLVTFVDDFHSNIEERLISIGCSMHGKILLIVHTEQQESEDCVVIRIISCRRVTLIERKTYEKG